MRASPLHIVDGATRGPDGRPLHPFARLVETVKREPQLSHDEIMERVHAVTVPIDHEGGDGI